MTNTSEFIEYHQFDNWEQARELLYKLSENIDPAIFRGQRESTWELTSTFERKHPPQQWMSYQLEHQLTMQFKKGIKTYLPIRNLPDSKFELLTAMQGYGLPTRLINFTRSPFISAYFAFECAAKSKYSTIWAVRDGILKCQNHDIYCSKDNRFNITKKNLSYRRTNFDIDNLLKKNIQGIIPVEPPDADVKNIVQQISLLLPTTLSITFENLLALYFKEPENTKKKVTTPVVKIDILSELRPKVLNNLNLMNINALTLFPGLEGFIRPEHWDTELF